MPTLQKYFDMEDVIFGVQSAEDMPITPKLVDGTGGHWLFPSKSQQCVDCSFDRSYWPIFGQILQKFGVDLELFAEEVRKKYNFEKPIFFVKHGKLQLDKRRIGCEIKFIDLLRLAHSLVAE